MANDDQIDDDSNEPSRLRQAIADANARAAAAEATAAELRTREVFRDAGLDLNNRQHQAFVKAYDGTPEPEAVRAYVSDLGITESAAPPPLPQGAGTDEQAAMERMADTARDGGTPPPTPDRRAELERQMDEAFRRGAPPAQLDELSMEFARAGGFPVKRPQ